MTTQMTPGAARVVDPVLSNVARQHKNKGYVLERIFPVIPVLTRAGRVIKFNKDSFRRYNTRRAPGADTKRMQVGYASDPFNLQQDSLEALTPRELQEEAGTVGVDMQSVSVMTVMDTLMLGTEIDRAALATDANNYATANKSALSGTDQFTDSSSDPKALVDAGREQVRKGVGHRANIMTMSPSIEDALCNHPKVRDQFKYTGNESITRAMLARFFKVDEVLVPETVSLPEGATEDADFTDIWGNFLHLAYVPDSVRGLHVPSFGYTYRLNGYPMVEASYFDKRAKSEVNGVTLEEAPHLTGGGAGFLFSNVVATS